MNTVVVDLVALVAEVAKTLGESLPPVSIVHSTPTAINAKTFILALRQAGMTVNDEGRKIRDPGLIREHEVQAIKDFTGDYDISGAHGLQLDAARRLAQKLLACPSSAMSESRPVSKGYVAGMPDRLSKAEQDIRARILFCDEVRLQAMSRGDTATANQALAKLTSLRNVLDQGDFHSVVAEYDQEVTSEVETKRLGWDLGSFGSCKG
jgi:hypothetical protein